MRKQHRYIISGMWQAITMCLLPVCMALLPASAQVRLPTLVSNGMVLQRGVANVWGWAAPAEAVELTLAGKTYRTTADEAGKWHIKLTALEAGGPHTMTIRASNYIVLNDILIGDVWVCSGQSNMELPMRRVRPRYESDIAAATNPNIRQFAVPQRYDFNAPQDDLPGGGWAAADPERVLQFSATAYFFACELYDAYQVPIGLINVALGGSPVEAWMSESALEAFPVHLAEARKFKDNALIQRIEQKDNTHIGEWYRLLWQEDEGRRQAWHNPETDVSAWGKMAVPGYWADADLGAVNGVVWFRKELQIPSELTGLPARIELGRIVDADSVYINGKFVGTTSYQYPPRWYEIPAGVLRAGKNILTVRVISNSGRGGFVPDKPYELRTGNHTFDLRGEWHYRLGVAMAPMGSPTFVRWKPLGLFNAMIHPLLNARIKGVIWYQGESNAGRPEEYRSLFPAMISDWRAHWQQGDFPFLFVQLANFMEARTQPSESDWALLREAQQQALALPNTGMAVTIDIGEWNDIHPLNKKDVGRRLALAARRTAYGESSLVASGPVFYNMKVRGQKVVLSFSETGGGLTISDGAALEGFALAGADRHFVWAKARIQKNKVTVQCAAVKQPQALRYAWADNPAGANLCNKEGLPASPFRTDNWSKK